MDIEKEDDVTKLGIDAGDAVLDVLLASMKDRGAYPPELTRREELLARHLEQIARAVRLRAPDTVIVASMDALVRGAMMLLVQRDYLRSKD